MSNSSYAGPRRPQVRITIPEAIKIIDSHGKQHVVYTVQIRAPNLHRQVAKKFSEFRTFDTVWRSKYPSVAVTLPPKVWLQNKSEKVIAERQVKLEAYLNALANIGSIVPYLSKFLGVPVEVLKPRTPPGPPEEPSVTHYRRRRNSGSSVQFSNASSASNLRSLGTRSEVGYDSSLNLSDDLVRQPITKKSEMRPEDALRGSEASTRSERKRRDESISGSEGVEPPKSGEPVRKSKVSITRTVTDFAPKASAATWSEDKSAPQPVPFSSWAGTVTNYNSVSECAVDFHSVLLMALEAVLATPSAASSSPSTSSSSSSSSFMEHDADIGSLLEGNWDQAGPATDMIGVRRGPDTYIL